MIDSKNAPIIRQASAADAEQIAAIYNWYIANSTATFELETVPSNTMAERIRSAETDNSWLVLELDGAVIAYAYAAQWKSRSAYSQSLETSVYVEHGRFGHGFGEALMRALIDNLRSKPIHVLIAGITLPNKNSVALHEKLGFTPIGVFSEVGYKFGGYVDVGYWQLTLEAK